MNFYLQEVLVYNLDICYGVFDIVLVLVEDFFFYVEKNVFVVVERCWSNILKMIKIIELLVLFFCVCVMVVVILEKSCCIYLLIQRYLVFKSQKRCGINVGMILVCLKRCIKRFFVKIRMQRGVIRRGYKVVVVLCDRYLGQRFFLLFWLIKIFVFEKQDMRFKIEIWERFFFVIGGR